MILVYMVMFASLLIISFIDIKEKRISGKMLIVLIFNGVASIKFNRDLSMAGAASAMLTVFIVLGIVSYISKGAMGMGDAKLCAAAAFCLGLEKAFSMLVFSMFLCGAAALILIMTDKTYKNKSLPFAPFITAGTLAALLL